MRPAGLDTIIIDLVQFGEDRGEARAIERETAKWRTIALLDVLEARGVALDDHSRARIRRETSLEQLRSWLRRAVTANAVGDVLSDRGPEDATPSHSIGLSAFDSGGARHARGGGAMAVSPPPPPSLEKSAESSLNATGMVRAEARAMPFADRAFRALAREEPDAVLALVTALASLALPADGALAPAAVDDPNLDPPPLIEADLVVRVGETCVLHVECQGYRDEDFVDRLFAYHLNLLLRYNAREIVTVALWLRRPPPEQRPGVLERRGLAIPITSIVLPDVPADELLADPRTACFAAGADRGEWTDDELCDRVARVLASRAVSARHQSLAIAAAGTRGRYDAMLRAMRRAGFDTTIIEDLVHLGEDRGEERGVAKGIEQGIERGRAEGIEQGIERGRAEMAATSLVEVLEARGVAVDDDSRARIRSETSLEQLQIWLRRAVTASAVRDLF